MSEPHITQTRAFIDEHANRVLAYEYVNRTYVTQRKLAPSHIADIMGIDTCSVHAIMGDTRDKTQSVLDNWTPPEYD